MRKIILFISFVFCFVFSFGQPVSNRSNGSLTVQDARGMWQKNAYLPRYLDTTEANLTSPNNIGIDSCGAIIYTYTHDAFWIRKCFPIKHWELIQNGGNSTILPTCGIKTGTGIITWDSLLVFDVTSALYALCCDNITRTTHDTTVTLTAADPDNPRIDAIILDQTGVNIVEGIAASDPALPQTDSCQIVLTYVLINAGQTTPANITSISIYDENDYVNGEWPMDSVSQVTADTADITTPVHLIHDIAISAYTTGGYMIFTSPDNIDLNNYNALKLYVRKNSGVLNISFAFYLDGVQKTTVISRSIPAALSNSYVTLIIPIQDFVIFGTDEVNKLRISLVGPQIPLFIDWIQLQAGVGPVTAIEGIQSLSGSTNAIMNDVVTNGNGPNSQILIPLKTQAAYTAFVNNQNVSAVPAFDKIDLGTPIVTGFLPPALIDPDGNNGDYLGQVGGVTNSYHLKMIQHL